MLRWLAIALLIVIADQGSKYWALTHLDYGVSVPVLPILSWTLLFNAGGAFSMFSDAGGWQVWLLLSVSILAAILIAWLLWQLDESDRLTGFALTLILGGDLGNLLDRIRLEYVVDFIHFHYQQWYFAAFNLADSAITLGAALLIWQWLREWRREKRKS